MQILRGMNMKLKMSSNNIFLIFFLVSIVLIIFFVCFFIILHRKIHLKVMNNSNLLKALNAINANTAFNNFDNFYLYEQHYDNKRNYLKIEPAYIMSYIIRENLEYFENIIIKIRENINLNEIYHQKVDLLESSITKEECKKLKINYKTFLRIENKYFRENIINPILDYSFTVIMYYSSPKRQVNLSKVKVFNFNEMYTCLDSVSRKNVSKSEYQKLSSVERGFVSDSLRYDVMLRDNFRCVICGASANEGARLHVDHIIPISKGGKSDISNLRTLCERCNLGKSNKIEFSYKSDRSVSNTSGPGNCPTCGANLVLRKGKYGYFYGCSNYPRCRFVKNIPKPTKL